MQLNRGQVKLLALIQKNMKTIQSDRLNCIDTALFAFFRLLVGAGEKG
jgi:hypothetical protein